MKTKYFLVLFISIASTLGAQSFKSGVFDPGAAREDMSNVNVVNVIRVIEKAPVAPWESSLPTNASFTLSLLSEKSYFSLTDKPIFGSMASETATDYLKLDGGNATFSHELDVQKITVGGVDIIGNISTALATILGE